MKGCISIFLLIPLLLQSCYVYQSASVPISSAVETGRVKILRPDGSSFEVSNISYDLNEYFTLVDDEVVIISEPDEKEYYLLNQRKTNTKKTIAIVFVFVIPFSVILLLGSISGLNNMSL